MYLPRRFRTLALSATCLSALLATGCRSTDTVHDLDEGMGGAVAKQDESEGDKKKGDDEESEEEKAEEKARSIAKKKHEIEMAKLEREMAIQKTETSMMGARQAVDRAEQEVDEAKKALEAYRTVERVVAMQRTELSLDGSRGRAEDAEAELKELEAMYAEEEFAESTKEIVIRRGRRSLDFSKRGLALAEADAKHEMEYRVPKRVRELERAIVKAEQGLEKARRSLAAEEMSAEIAERKAAFKMQELEHELAKLMEDKS